MVGEVLDQLDAVLDSVRAIDVDALTDDDNERLMYGCARTRVQLLVVQARTARRWERSCTWASDGSKSATARFARDMNCSPREARQSFRIGRALEAMPHTAAALASAAISAAHVDALIAANSDARREVFAVDEEMLVGHARSLRFAEFTKVVDYWCERVDPDGCERLGRDLLAKNSVSLSTTMHGTLYVQGLLDPVGGEIFRNGLDRIIGELKQQDRVDGATRTVAERRAAALVEMAIRANAARPGAKRPEPLLLVAVGAGTLSRLCELASGAVVTPGLLAPYLSSTQIQGIVYDDAQPLPSMSPQRTFTGWLRRAVQIRDRHCQHASGCDEPITRCDVDHLLPDARGGRTEYANGRLLCQTHNRNPTYDDRAPPDP